MWPLPYTENKLKTKTTLQNRRQLTIRSLGPPKTPVKTHSEQSHWVRLKEILNKNRAWIPAKSLALRSRKVKINCRYSRHREDCLLKLFLQNRKEPKVPSRKSLNLLQTNKFWLMSVQQKKKKQTNQTMLTGAHCLNQSKLDLQGFHSHFCSELLRWECPLTSY